MSGATEYRNTPTYYTNCLPEIQEKLKRILRCDQVSIDHTKGLNSSHLYRIYVHNLHYSCTDFFVDLELAIRFPFNHKDPCKNDNKKEFL